jgi:hypothetical protein
MLSSRLNRLHRVNSHPPNCHPEHSEGSAYLSPSLTVTSSHSSHSLPVFSIAALACAHSNVRNPNPLMRLLHDSLDTRRGVLTQPPGTPSPQATTEFPLPPVASPRDPSSVRPLSPLASALIQIAPVSPLELCTFARFWREESALTKNPGAGLDSDLCSLLLSSFRRS